MRINRHVQGGNYQVTGHKLAKISVTVIHGVYLTDSLSHDAVVNAALTVWFCYCSQNLERSCNNSCSSVVVIDDPVLPLTVSSAWA